MFRIQPAPPVTQSSNVFKRIYNDPFQWSLVKGAIGFIAGVIIARSVSEEWSTLQ
ncbi:hypothetical protein AB6A40_001136 [Gnathostoma spinigerum]|uniref:Uncharacterized protein n=1 Tax=Gnathostoma spinigerum TaxID=75299 RepID=A0ABD6E5L4_9BILA